MRKGNDPAFIYHGDVCVGINLSADYCAEHEWGLGHLVSDFGLPTASTRDLYGVPCRTATRHNPNLRLLTYGQYTYLIATDWSQFDRKVHTSPRAELDQMMQLAVHDDAALVTAWAGGTGSGEFGIRVGTPEGAQQLQTLYRAANRSLFFAPKTDLAMWLAYGAVFKNAGLVIVMPSKLPRTVREEMARNDLAALDLRDAALATGIAAKLSAAGKQWHALEPKRPEAIKGITTGHSVIFWLNPVDQSKNNCGWFSVEDLEAWITNTGPIPKVQTS